MYHPVCVTSDKHHLNYGMKLKQLCVQKGLGHLKQPFVDYSKVFINFLGYAFQT